MTPREHAATPRPHGWVSPLDVAIYDRRPDLTSDERAALALLAGRYPGWVKARAALVAVERLVRPLYDALERGACALCERHGAVRVVAGEMHRRQTAH